MYPSDYLYTNDHEWLKDEGKGIYVMGITSYAQKQLGDIVFVELPTAGHKFSQRDELGSIESVKAVAQIFAPVSGEVVEINQGLQEEPELIADDPHGEGWMIRLKATAPGEIKTLMDAGQYEKFCKGLEA